MISEQAPCTFLYVCEHTTRAQLANLGFADYKEKKMGLWDYTQFEFGITEIRIEFGIIGFHSPVQNRD